MAKPVNPESPLTATARRDRGHTPGPWKTLRGVDDDDTRWIVVAAGADREYLIATIENGQPGDDLETEAATASLIAAAPDLLDACKEALLWYGPDGDHVSEPARSVLLAAIAKAEGHD